jgi:Cu+-exporting ATPase
MPYGEFERLSHPTVADVAAGPSLAVPARLTTSIDPVCGAQVDAHAIAEWSEHRGERFYFCSRACKMEFDDNPGSYASGRI